MRPVLKKLGKLTLQLLSIFLIIVACGKDDGPEVDDSDPKTNPDNPDGVVRDSLRVYTNVVQQSDTIGLPHTFESNNRIQNLSNIKS